MRLSVAYSIVFLWGGADILGWGRGATTKPVTRCCGWKDSVCVKLKLSKRTLRNVLASSYTMQPNATEARDTMTLDRHWTIPSTILPADVSVASPACEMACKLTSGNLW